MEREIRMLDSENAAKDRYDFALRILRALNAEDYDDAKKIVKDDMRVYEEEYLYVLDDEESKKIELNSAAQTRI